MTKQEFLAFSLPYGLQGTVKGKSNISGEFTKGYIEHIDREIDKLECEYANIK